MTVAVLSFALCSSSGTSDHRWATKANVVCEEFIRQRLPEVSTQRTEASQKALRSGTLDLAKKLQELPNASARVHGVTDGMAKTVATLGTDGDQEISLAWLPEMKGIGATACWGIFTGPSRQPMTRALSARYLGADTQRVPLFVPLFFVAWGVLVALCNRKSFKDPESALRRSAARRAQSRFLRLLGGSGDPEKEYQMLRISRSLTPLVAVIYSAFVFLLLVVALSQL